MSDFDKMPKLGFGMMRLPEKDQGLDIPQICDMVDAYMDAGMNYFDTAYMYCNGASECAVKEALVDRYPRESFWLTSKLPVWMMEEIGDRDRILEDQLKRTEAGYFDIYLLHSIEDGDRYEGYQKYDTFRWAMEKKKQGLIRHFGFSFHGTPELLDEVLRDHPEMEIVQLQLNYADWTNPLVESGKLYEIARKYDLPIIVMEPVKGGLLAQPEPKIREMFQAERPGASAASWALRFAASLPGVVTVLSGMSDTEQMKDNLHTFAEFEPLSEKEQELVEKARTLIMEAPTVPCTSCRYCCDGCPAGIEIPEIIKALNGLRIYEEDSRPHFFYEGLTEHSGKAKDCVQCGQCENVCPQHLPVISLLKEASEKLDKESQE